jgi:hypothetical protein
MSLHMHHNHLSFPIFFRLAIIIHNETMAGISDGGRTGLNALVIGICFLCSMPLIPLLESVPSVASSAPLVIVGMFMMSMGKYIDWDCIDEALPAFLTATILPFTYSIANGMIAGLISYAAIKVVADIKHRYIKPHVHYEHTAVDHSDELDTERQTPYHSDDFPTADVATHKDGSVTPKYAEERDAAVPLLGLSSPFLKGSTIQKRARQSPPHADSVDDLEHDSLHLRQHHHLSPPPPHSFTYAIEAIPEHDLSNAYDQHQQLPYSYHNDSNNPNTTSPFHSGLPPPGGIDGNRASHPASARVSQGAGDRAFVSELLGLPNSGRSSSEESGETRKSFGTKYQNQLPII